MPRALPLCVALPLALALPPIALAQGDISDPPVLFQRTVTPFDTTPTADLEGVSATSSQDHLFETGWWFRVEGDTQETVFPAPDTQSYVGGSSSLTWNDVGARGLFSAIENTSVYNSEPLFGQPSGYVAMGMAVTNLSAQNTLNLELFHLADLDVTGPGTDSAAWVQYTPYPVLELTDPSGDVAFYVSSIPWTAFLVRPFGPTDVATVLSNTTVTDFDDSGLPFGPGDFTGGWQYSLSIPPGQMVFVGAYLMVNHNVYCFHTDGVHCDGFESQDLYFWSASQP
jgi:hypothetical protein